MTHYVAQASSISTTGHDIDGKYSSSVVVFNLMSMPLLRWTFTSVCSISATDHDSDGKCSSSSAVLLYLI